MKDLQVAFLRAQISDQDLPQDAAFFSGLYKFARKHKIKYVLTGGNYSTECCREPEEWGGYPGIAENLPAGRYLDLQGLLPAYFGYADCKASESCTLYQGRSRGYPGAPVRLETV
ncbi:hypothetical protein D3C80_1832350 [compost metagenome]